MKKVMTCLLCAGLFLLSAGAAFAKEPKSKKQTLSFTCRVVYEPSRAMWARELEIDYDKKNFVELRIDGVKAHGFSASGTQIGTHMDNERIEIDLSIPSWKSQFREAAQGQGVCVKNR